MVIIEISKEYKSIFNLTTCCEKTRWYNVTDANSMGMYKEIAVLYTDV